MEVILSSIFSIFFIIFLGYIFKKISFPSKDFWPLADKLTYFIMMPALLIYSLKSAKLDLLEFSTIATLLLAIICTSIFLIILNKISSTNNPSFTSIMQGGTRFNTYIFLALSAAIYGEFGLVLSSIILSFVIIFLNILNVSIFILYIKDENDTNASKSKIDIKYFFKSIFKNPLIIACLIGVSINYLKIPIPLVVDNSLKILSSTALALGLLSIGNALVLENFKQMLKDIFVSNFAKFLIFPLFTYIFILIFDIDKQTASILMLFALMPTATSAFILARQLGGDTKLMSAIITVQTLISAPILLLFLAYYS